MFTIGGILKLLGDLTALVGPLSISQIVEYIDKQNNETTVIVKNNLIVESNENFTTIYTIDDKNMRIYYPSWIEFISNGWIIGVFVLLSSLAQGTLSQASTHIVNMVGIHLKTSIQGLVYRKTLLLSSSCFFGGNKIDEDNSRGGGFNEDSEELKEKKKTIRETSADAGSITNLMSEDSFNVMSFFWIAHYVWAIPLKVITIC